MKYYELIILVICLIMGISTVSAGNVNSSDDFVSDYEYEILSDEVITDEIELLIASKFQLEDKLIVLEDNFKQYFNEIRDIV